MFISEFAFGTFRGGVKRNKMTRPRGSRCLFACLMSNSHFALKSRPANLIIQVITKVIAFSLVLKDVLSVCPNQGVACRRHWGRKPHSQKHHLYLTHKSGNRVKFFSSFSGYQWKEERIKKWLCSGSKNKCMRKLSIHLLELCAVYFIITMEMSGWWGEKIAQYLNFNTF